MGRNRGSLSGSLPGSRHSSPQRLESQMDLSALNTTLNQLTAVVTMVAENQVRQQAEQSPSQASSPQTVGPSADPEFDWLKLFVPPVTAFPPATEGQVQHLAEGLLSRVNSIRGRDLHEVRFVLQMASQYPKMSPEAQHQLYQRLNFYYIVVHHGWQAAISAANAVPSSAAVFPPGFSMLAATRTPQQTYARQLYKGSNNS